MSQADIWVPGSSPSRRLVLLRHGRTAWNVTGRAQGNADVPLDEIGRAEAERAAEQLASYQPSLVWSSDLGRARETAQAVVARLTGVELVLDKRLREYDVGVREGLTFPEFAATYPDLYVRFMAGDEDAVPGAETTPRVCRRMVDVLDDAAAALAPGETGVVVGHGAALRTGLLAFLGVPPEFGDLLAGMANCAWAVLGHRGPHGWQIIDYNARTLPEPASLADDPRG